MSDTEFIIRLIISGVIKLATLAWLTIVFYPLPWWPDLEGDLHV